MLQSAMKLVERLDVSILKSTRHVITFAKMLAGSPEAETVSMALGLLTALLSGAVLITKEDDVCVLLWFVCRPGSANCHLVTLQVYLSDLHGWLEPYTHHPDEQLREMALDLRQSIRTRDESWGTLGADTASAPPHAAEKCELVSRYATYLCPWLARPLCQLVAPSRTSYISTFNHACLRTAQHTSPFIALSKPPVTHAIRLQCRTRPSGNGHARA